MTKSEEQILSLSIGDDKGRVTIPIKNRNELNLKPGSKVELTYLKVKGKKTNPPYSETSVLDEMNRFQTTTNTRNYLNLNKKEYFLAKISLIE